MRSRSPAVFLDRDGTLVHDVSYIRSPDQVRLLPGVAPVLVALELLEIPRVIVTNQSGIARGMFSEADYEAVHGRLTELLAEQGASITAEYHCPHHPDFTGACECRKPGTQLFERAAAELNLAPEASLFIGDRWRDVQPGLALGGTAALVPAASTPESDVATARAAGLLAENLAEAVSRWRVATLRVPGSEPQGYNPAT
ncbi:MAG TPA: HAD family hydrolase [Gemmatimonadales bacterium]|nr:HAD family hydrolase [Gemmatimonadales bacterium]